jgi:hypothetical protein
VVWQTTMRDMDISADARKVIHATHPYVLQWVTIGTEMMRRNRIQHLIKPSAQPILEVAQYYAPRANQKLAQTPSSQMRYPERETIRIARLFPQTEKLIQYKKYHIKLDISSV